MEEKKTRVTVYLTQEIENMLNELLIKDIRDNTKFGKSSLICEAIKLLYKDNFS